MNCNGKNTATTATGSGFDGSRHALHTFVFYSAANSALSTLAFPAGRRRKKEPQCTYMHCGFRAASITSQW